MLRNTAIAAIKPAIEQCKQRNKHLVAVVGSPLDELVIANAPTMVTVGMESASLDDYIEAVKPDGENDIEHATLVDHFSSTIAAKIIKQKTLAKDVVIPAISKVYEDVRTSVDLDFAINADLVKFELPASVVHYQITDMIEESLPTNQPTPKEFGALSGFPALTEEQIIEMLGVTANRNFHECLIEDIASKPIGWVVGVYEDYFRDTPVELYLGKNKRKFLANNNEALALVVALLIACNFEDNPPSVNLTLSEYNAIMSSFKRGIYTALDSIIRSYSRNCNSRIVIDYGSSTGDLTNNKGMIIAVYKSAYEEYIKLGGTSETIIGAILAKRAMHPSGRDLSVQSLIEHKKTHADFYSSYLRKQGDLHLQRVPDEIRSVLLKSMSEFIQSMTIEQNVMQLDKDEMLKVVRNYVMELNGYSLANETYLWTKNTLIDVCYPKTSMGKILAGIDKAMIEDPTQDINKGVYHATLALAAEYVASQIKAV